MPPRGFDRKDSTSRYGGRLVRCGISISLCRRWVRMRTTQSEQNESAPTLIADIRADIDFWRECLKRIRLGPPTISAARPLCPSEADVGGSCRDVAEVPLPDSCTAATSAYWISGVTAIILPALAPEHRGFRRFRAQSPDSGAALCPHRARAAGSVRSR